MWQPRLLAQSLERSPSGPGDTLQDVSLTAPRRKGMADSRGVVYPLPKANQWKVIRALHQHFI